MPRRPRRHDLGCELEAKIHARGANMEEEVARRGGGMARAADFAEGMQVFGFRRAEEPAPSVRADPHDAVEPAIEGANPTPRTSAARSPQKLRTAASRVRPGVDRDDEKNGGARQPGVDSLRNCGGHTGLLSGRQRKTSTPATRDRSQGGRLADVAPQRSGQLIRLGACAGEYPLSTMRHSPWIGVFYLAFRRRGRSG